VIILHLDDGSVQRLDPRREDDLRSLDSTSTQKKVRRVAVADGDGKRVDLPINKNGIYRMWMEVVEKNGEVRGERFCMRSSVVTMRATLYYSDSRVVIDLDLSGGFRCSQQGMSH
jgi:hypothetical protein